MFGEIVRELYLTEWRECKYPECKYPGGYTLSGRIGKVVASHAAIARSSPAEVCTDLYYARGAQGVLPIRAGVRPVNWIYRL